MLFAFDRVGATATARGARGLAGPAADAGLGAAAINQAGVLTWQAANSVADEVWAGRRRIAKGHAAANVGATSAARHHLALLPESAVNGAGAPLRDRFATAAGLDAVLGTLGIVCAAIATRWTRRLAARLPADADLGATAVGQAIVLPW